MNTKQTALAFVEAINKHCVEAIVQLMAPTHVFIDSYGTRQSRDKMLEGWPGYFAWFPDYKIEVTDIFESGSTVAILGYAGGTHSETGKQWRLPAAWKVVTENGKVLVWQVFCDSKIPYECME